MPEGYTHLTPDDRCQIEVLLKRGDSLREIGRLVGRPASTIRREIARNAGLRGYRKWQAQLSSAARRSAASQRAKKMTPEVIAGVEAKLLDEQWSSEQISRWMRRQETPDAVRCQLSRRQPFPGSVTSAFTSMSGRTRKPEATCGGTCATTARNTTDAKS